MKLGATKGKVFRRFSAVTIIAVYLLILVGGIVRTTGAGMGCPDWPKCFGSWVPPTEVNQLPSNYKEVYAQQRAEKNDKFVGYLRAFGFDDLADQILNDPDILTEEEFNATKTYIEYINRLIGAVIGLLILGTFLMSLRYRKSDKTITVLSFIAFVLVGFQGWIGSIVVSTNLLHWMITIHMLIAILIVCLLIYVYFRSLDKSGPILIVGRNKITTVLVITILLSVIQVVLGTQVRETIDIISDELNRNEWIANLGVEFKIHRSYSILLVAVHLYLAQLIIVKNKEARVLKSYMGVLLIVIGISVLSGVIMAYFGVPAAMQPIHLLLGTLIIGVQYYLLLLVRQKRIQIN